jgi:hypothetical protein
VYGRQSTWGEYRIPCSLEAAQEDHNMENFVFNLFSDKLSKIILDFSPDSINANFLNGRGSITDVWLNVDLINDYLRPSCPA